MELSAPVTRARRIGAVIASVSAPGAGLFVLGRWERGLVWVAAAMVGLVVGYAGFVFHPPLLLAGLFVGPFVWVGSLVDTIRARAGRTLPPLALAVGAWFAIATVDRVPALLLQAFVVEAYKIPSGSMQPTLEVGDHVFVEKHAYASALPKRGDLVVYRHPEDTRKTYAKRIVGLPGDEILISKDVLSINGAAQGRSSGGSETVGDATCEAVGLDRFTESLGEVTHEIFHARGGGFEGGPWTVPEGRYFVLGDNRDNSNDSSRSPNYMIPLDHIIGRVSFVWLSWDPCQKRIRTERFGRVVH